jgi:peptidoglycan/xylan/chitin deacetylase (PgdA/CDA1 family)
MSAPLSTLLSILAVSAGAPALRPIRHVQTSEPAVAITFDACATKTHGYGFDRALFDLIRSEKLPVTIFVSGRWVEMHADAMQELVAEPLVEFGDHSYDHPHMSRLPEARIADEVAKTEAALGRYGKKSVAFRPPFGDWNRRVVHVVQDKQQLPTVTWDVVSGDPSAKTTTEGMIRTVVGKARPGSIVIFHINGRGRRTAEALPRILSGLRERGLRFVFLSELLATKTPAKVPVEAAQAQAQPPLPEAAPTPLPDAPHAPTP